MKPATLFLILLSSSVSHAAVTITYSLPNNANQALAVTTGTDAASINAGNMLISTGTDEGSASADTGFSTLGNVFLRSDATGVGTDAALADDDYFSFTINVTTSQTFQIDSFQFNFGGSGPTGLTSNAVVQSSVGGFGTGNPTLTVTPSSKVVTSGNTIQYATGNVTVSGFTVNSSNPVTFQIRFFDNKTDPSEVNRLDDVVVNLSAVPEPSVFLLGALGVLPIFRRRR